MSVHRMNYTDQPMLRHEREIVWRCEVCKGELESNTSDFTEARTLLRENNWLARNEGGKWRHYCENCRNAGA